EKVPKRGTFSEVLGVSSSAELDSGRCPKNPPTFEKVGSKLLYLRQPLFFCCYPDHRTRGKKRTLLLRSLQACDNRKTVRSPEHLFMELYGVSWNSML
ncbi:MAG: hypothetical protein IKI93_13690, partial [Clostridia bacterium]|nr:hypothetical protein [Clostridia bacterium]